MTDYFALLNEPRRPWLDADSLKGKFLALSADLHPDRVHNAADAEKTAAANHYAQLNSAYNCLREPKDRLRHLLELELGRKPKEVQEIPPDLADLFVEVAQLCREANAFLVEQGKVSSALLRVQLFERGQEWTTRLNTMQRRLAERQEQLVQELRLLDAAWDRTTDDSTSRESLLERLEEIHRLLSFYARWNYQIQEAVVQLTL